MVTSSLLAPTESSSSLSDVLLDQLRSHHPDEGGVGGVGDGLGHEGLSGPRGTDEEDSLRGFYTDLLVQFGPEQGILDRFAQLEHLLLEASDVVVRDIRLLHDLRSADHGVHGWREDVHERQRLLIERHPGTDYEVLGGTVLGYGDDEIRSGGALDDDAVVGEDVPKGGHDQRGSLDALHLVPQPGEVLLDSEQLRLGMALVGLRRLKLRHQFDVPLFEYLDLLLKVLGAVVLVVRHCYHR